MKILENWKGIISTGREGIYLALVSPCISSGQFIYFF